MLNGARQIGEIVAFDFDQPQTLAGIFRQQRPDQRRLAGAPRAPQQRVVGRQSGHELAGVAGELIALAIDTQQIGQAQFQIDLERLQIAAMAFPTPARRIAVLPVQRFATMGQQGFEALQHLPGVEQKVF